MKKTAFVFPGQGAQYIGMGMDLLAADEELRQALRQFDERHRTDLFTIMQAGPEEALRETRFTQPAILLHSIAALKALQKQVELAPAFVAGHSLGEFTALVANGMLSLQDGLHIVHKRGEFMIKANAGVPFAMAAVIGLGAQQVIDICAEAESAGLVRAVNFNTPVQTVISGTQTGVEAACELAKARGAKRVLPLAVGGPFHTPLIEQAKLWLQDELEMIDLSPSDIPVISNVDTRPETDRAAVRQKLVRQIISPVRWVESVECMLAEGVKRFVEFGPQKVLSGMIKNIDKEAEVLNVDKLDDIAAVKAAVQIS